MRKRVGALLSGAYLIALILFAASTSLCIAAYRELQSLDTAWAGWARIDAMGTTDALSYGAWSALKLQFTLKGVQVVPLQYGTPTQTRQTVLISEGDFLKTQCGYGAEPFGLVGVRSDERLPVELGYQKRTLYFEQICNISTTPLLEWTLEPFYMIALETALRLNESVSIRTLLVYPASAVSVVRTLWTQQVGHPPQLQVRGIKEYAQEFTQKMQMRILQIFGIVLSLGVGLILSTGFFWYRLVVRKESWLRYVFGQTPQAIQAGLQRQVRQLQWQVMLGAFLLVQGLEPLLKVHFSVLGYCALFFLSWSTPKILLQCLHPERYSYQMQRTE